MADEIKKTGGGFRISNLKVDPVKERDGVWFSLGPDARIKVARLTSEPFQNAMARKGKAYQKLIRAGALDITSPEMQNLMREEAANHILLGWENILDDQDQPIPFSPKKALELFQETPDFYRIVLEFANDADAFRASAMEAAAKN